MRMITGTLALAALAASLVACSGAATASVAPGASMPAGFPLGSWVVTITPQDLRDGGITDEGAIGENSGTFTKTYAADGTWTNVQESTKALLRPVFSGTWRAIGDDRIQEITAFPSDYVGEVIMFTWQREGSGIRFTVLDAPDPILPITTETHLWLPK